MYKEILEKFIKKNKNASISVDADGNGKFILIMSYYGNQLIKMKYDEREMPLENRLDVEEIYKDLVLYLLETGTVHIHNFVTESLSLNEKI